MRVVVVEASGAKPEPWVVEDLTQEAFLKARQRWPRIGRYDNPGAWMRRTAINLALSAPPKYQSAQQRERADPGSGMLGLAVVPRGYVRCMPRISAFYGIVIAMYFDDHPPARSFMARFVALP